MFGGPQTWRRGQMAHICEWYSFYPSRRRHTRYIGDWSSDVCSSYSSRRRHTRYIGDWSSDVCSSDLWGLVGRVVVHDQMELLVRRRAAVNEFEKPNPVATIVGGHADVDHAA